MTNSDDELKRVIDAELASDPKVKRYHIGVSAEAGTVSLFGTVDSYADKDAAEAAARRVGGVRSLAQRLTVKIEGDKNDVEATPTQSEIVDQHEIMN